MSDYLFVQFLKENAAMFNSDFAFADNYQFKKKGADTLVLTVGDIEYTFLKKEKTARMSSLSKMLTNGAIR